MQIGASLILDPEQRRRPSPELVEQLSLARLDNFFISVEASPPFNLFKHITFNYKMLTKPELDNLLEQVLAPN